MLERLDDFDLAVLVLARSGEDSVPVSLDAL
jgi:antitoxin StbD